MAQFDVWIRVLALSILFYSSPIYSDNSKDVEARELMVEKLGRAFMIVCEQLFAEGVVDDEVCQNALKPPDSSTPSPEDFSKYISKKAPQTLKKYNRPCKTLTKDPNAIPQVNESAVLQDHGLQYGLRAYAHCLVDSVRKIDGDEALKIYSEEKIATKGRTSLIPKRDWLKTIHEETNKFRVRHSVTPLILKETLNKDAQEMADNNARTCTSKHSDRDDREKNTGQWTGENLCWRQADEAIDDIAERCANAWYEEIDYYPFPFGWIHKADGSADALLKKFGHFTQMVWKDSDFVGYGIGSTRNCSKDGRLEYYVVARYLPGGNRRCCFRGSVFPAKNSSNMERFSGASRTVLQDNIHLVENFFLRLTCYKLVCQSQINPSKLTNNLIKYQLR